MQKQFTVTEAALATRRHPETIRDALRLGEIHGVQRSKGANWRINEECLDAWMLGEECSHMRAKVAA